MGPKCAAPVKRPETMRIMCIAWALLNGRTLFTVVLLPATSDEAALHVASNKHLNVTEFLLRFNQNFLSCSFH